jgi:hypothetical protein
MIYEIRLSVPKNTTADNPAIEEFYLFPGTISLVGVEFAPGCCGLVHCQIKYNETTLWPYGSGQDFIGDGMLPAFPEDLKLVESTNRFQLIGWSDDETYEHTVILRLAVVESGKTIQDVLDRIIGTNNPISLPGSVQNE